MTAPHRMSDIVERLRSYASYLRIEKPQTACVLDDGAAEIRRLRAERDALKALLREAVPHITGNVGEWERLKTQNISDDCNEVCIKRIAEGRDLLRRIEEVTK